MTHDELEARFLNVLVAMRKPAHADPEVWVAALAALGHRTLVQVQASARLEHEHACAEEVATLLALSRRAIYPTTPGHYYGRWVDRADTDPDSQWHPITVYQWGAGCCLAATDPVNGAARPVDEPTYLEWVVDHNGKAVPCPTESEWLACREMLEVSRAATVPFGARP